MKKDKKTVDILYTANGKIINVAERAAGNMTSELIWLLKRIKKLLDTSDQM